MSGWPHLRKISVIAAGTSAGLAAYFYNKLRYGTTVSGSESNDIVSTINPCARWDHNWDFRDVNSLVRPVRTNNPADENRYNKDIEERRSKASRHIILVRHGEYLDKGDTDDTHNLTERGRIQAKYTGKRLKDLGIKWNKVIASTMTRAQETTNIVLEEINYEQRNVLNCPFLREGAPIPPQPPVEHWKPEATFFRDGSRIEAAFRRYFYRADGSQKQDSYTLIVGHGNVFRYFVCRALQFPPEAWLRISINHASITWLTIQPNGNVVIKHLGESGHIPPELLTHKIPKGVVAV